MPVTLNDMQKMKNEIVSARENKLPPQAIICDNGVSRYCPPEEELDKLLAMLIPLGQTDICPQTETTFAENMEYNPEVHSDDFVHSKTRGFYLIKEGKLIANIYTCKHFDTANMVCTNYENRPEMCKMFGRQCKYKGCDFLTDEKMSKCSNDAGTVQTSLAAD